MKTIDVSFIAVNLFSLNIEHNFLSLLKHFFSNRMKNIYGVICVPFYAPDFEKVGCMSVCLSVCPIVQKNLKLGF